MPITEIILTLNILLVAILLFNMLETKGHRTHTLIFIGFVVAVLIAGFCIKNASGSLKPIFFGAAIAYIFKPMCNFFYTRLYDLFSKKRTPAKAKKLAHYLSIVCTYLIWFAILYILLAAVLPKIAEAIISFGTSLPSFFSYLLSLANQIAEENDLVRTFFGEMLKELESDVTAFYDLLKGYLQPIASGFVGIVMDSVTFIFNVFVGFIVSVYLLLGRKKMTAQSKLLVKSVFSKKWSDIIFSEVSFADKMFSGYFVGSLIDSAIVGVICYIACLIMGTPYAELVSVIVTVANLIPFFGPYIGMLPSALIILSVSPIHALTFIIMLWLLQQIDGNIIAPKIIGSNTGLSSFWVLFSILLFGGLFGFVGMIIGAPVFAVIYDICGKLMRQCLKHKGETDAITHYETEFLAEEQQKVSAIDKLVDKVKKVKNSFKKTDPTEDLKSTEAAPEEDSITESDTNIEKNPTAKNENPPAKKKTSKSNNQDN